MNDDNKRLCYIEGGRFESKARGDERDATIAEIKMPEGFKLSSQPLVMLEVEEWNDLIRPVKCCLWNSIEIIEQLRKMVPVGIENAELESKIELLFDRAITVANGHDIIRID